MQITLAEKVEPRMRKRHTVGVADMKISKVPEDEIITHSLGSCIGISIYDPVAMVGGIIHFQLPESSINKEKAMENPFVFADTGTVKFLERATAHGADLKRIVVKVAGGSNMADKNGFFEIGRRNYLVMKKVLWKNSIYISAEDVGGESWRTMWMEIGTGRVFVKNGDGTKEL